MQYDQQEKHWGSAVHSTARPNLARTGLKPTRRNEVAGVACEYLIKAILIDKGFVVSTPDISTGYDFITDWDDGVINRVQVRSSCRPQPIQRSKRKRYQIKTIRALGNYTVLIIHIQPTQTSYIIPWDALQGPCVSLTEGRPNYYDQFIERWELLHTTH